MRWLDNLWRRRRGRTTETPEDRARVRKEERAQGAGEDADALEERVEDERDDVVMREPRVPPGTG